MSQTLIIDCGSSKVPAIEKILADNKISFTTIKLEMLNAFENIASIIISGAPVLLTEVGYKNYLERIKPIFQLNDTPILGICFGHQLMGLIHGSSISRCKESRTWEEINFIKPFDLLPNRSTKLQFKEDHCECISLPQNFDLIASSNTCDVEVMKHVKNPWFGVQFHPETSGKLGHELIVNFIAVRCET